MCEGDQPQAQEDEIEIEFPLEFPIHGTPVSLQASGKSRNAWQNTIRGAYGIAVPGHKFASEKLLSVTIYDFPTDEPSGDIDNIVKPILDAMIGPVYVDDRQVRRVVAQRFLQKDIADFGDELPLLLGRALVHNIPFVYVRVTDDPLGEAR